MRKYVFHLYNYILHVYAGRPGGYPGKKKKKKVCFLGFDSWLVLGSPRVRPHGGLGWGLLMELPGDE